MFNYQYKMFEKIVEQVMAAVWGRWYDNTRRSTIDGKKYLNHFHRN